MLIISVIVQSNCNISYSFYIKCSICPLCTGRRTLKMGCYRSGLVGFKTLDISQGSVATQLMCGGIFSDSTITNFLLILTVK